MTELTETLQSLLQICRDGIAFYRAAAAKVVDVEVRATINQMIGVRQRLIDEFGELLDARGESVPEIGTYVGTMRKVYADVLACLSDDADGVYVSQLEEAEDRLLHTFEDAIVSITSPESAAILRRYVPVAREAHDRMRSLKERKGA